ncbi:Lucine Rich Repeat family protein [Blumeria hordei DH14]|uniref:Lucine Rich Repeat family protein n=1 Tax=Blumeria graminis f. sp. hordei (strain DH14) TaxID=546991 RepID=N1JCS0_BLUG1|nr:Lucine Rich Repeat family protein [Blumeria hordei DH14]
MDTEVRCPGNIENTQHFNAQFVRTHEKALANALQLKRQQTPKHGASLGGSGSAGSGAPSRSPTSTSQPVSALSPTTSSTLAAALSLPSLTFACHSMKPAKLALTPHHLFYLLSRFEELGIAVGPTNVRLENLHSDTSATNYVSFGNQAQRPRSGPGSDHGSVHSVSSVRSVMSGMTSLWTNFGLGSTGAASRNEKQKLATEVDLKYLYASFTKIPCLRLAPDRRARLIKGYEEFPFDTAVPLLAFKNVSALEISDIDIRQFFGWDKISEQLRSLTIKRAGVETEDLIINIVLDDMDKRRRRSARTPISPTAATSPRRSPTISPVEPGDFKYEPSSPSEQGFIEMGAHNRRESIIRPQSIGSTNHLNGRPRSYSPIRPSSSRTGYIPGNQYIKTPHKVKRSGSGSSQSSISDSWYNSHNCPPDLLSTNILPVSKWRFLKHLSLADNGITSISASSILPLTDTLHSLDLSSNHLTEIPECLATLTALRALNLSNCMINSLHSLAKSPLLAVTALNLRSNRLNSLAGIEHLYSLERLDIRDNRLVDPTELARLTGIMDLREVWVLGNPFTRTHSTTYRVTIFNIFRQVPGYMEDIIIDTYAPGYSERRQLLERVTEKPAVPIIKSPKYAPKITQINKPSTEFQTDIKPAVLRKERSSQNIGATEVQLCNSRQKKISKRRIIDLSALNPTTSRSTVHFSLEAPQAPHNTAKSVGYDISSPGSSPRSVSPYAPLDCSNTRSNKDSKKISPALNSHLTAREPPLTDTKCVKPESQKEILDWKTSGDVYRKKLEVIRNEVGNGWLTVLSEDHWDTPKPPESFRGAEFSKQTIIH